MPPNTVKVARPTRWGNPFRIGMFVGYTAEDAVRDYEKWIDRDLTMRSCDIAFGEPPTPEEIRGLRGKNLACFCAPGSPCHRDVLLKKANQR